MHTPRYSGVFWSKTRIGLQFLLREIMATIWLSSDQHLGHANILTFTGADGKLIRPQFKDVDEMNEYIIAQHNAVVKPQDHWYCVGDVVMNKKWLYLVKRMNGQKRIVLGNHDPDVQSLLAAGFEKIYGSRRLSDVILTHYPLHDSSVYHPNVLGNVHGHIHQNPSPDGPFLNVSVEALQDYTPITLEDAQLHFRKQRAASEEFWRALSAEPDPEAVEKLRRALSIGEA